MLKNLNPFLIEKNIDVSALPPCAQNIVNKIKNLTQNDFAKIIALLGGENSPYNVTFTHVQNLLVNTNDLAQTYISQSPNTSNFNYTIAIDSQYLNTGTQLSIASTILHELIHTYFLSLVANQYATGVSALNTYPQLWDYYVNSNMAGVSPQHNVMAQFFTNILAIAIQEFDTGVVLGVNQNPQQLYTDLAWNGLHTTQIYSALPTVDKYRIFAVNSAEIQNSPNTTNGVTYNPTSTPCN